MFAYIIENFYLHWSQSDNQNQIWQYKKDSKLKVNVNFILLLEIIPDLLYMYREHHSNILTLPFVVLNWRYIKVAWDSSYCGILFIEINNKSKYIFPLPKLLPNCVAAQWVRSLTKTLKVMNSNEIGAFMIFVLRFTFYQTFLKIIFGQLLSNFWIIKRWKYFSNNIL